MEIEQPDPGGTILLAAHRGIESITLDGGAMHLKDELMPRYAKLIYNGFWFSPEREMLQALIDASQDPAEFEQSLECLTQAVYYEARSQSADGQRAVAQVVLNRVRHPSYPNSVCGVVFQGSERVTGCQFTFTCDGSMYGGIEPLAWERAQRIARAALAGSVYRPAGLALNYHTTAIRPYWAPSLVRQAVVGDHIFYRRPNSSEASFVQTPGEETAIPASATTRSVDRRSAQRIRVHTETVRYERAVLEIPVVERPVRVQTVGARPAASSRATPRRTAAPASGPSVRVESGVRVARGS